MNGDVNREDEANPSKRHENHGEDYVDWQLREAGDILLNKLRVMDAKDIALILTSVALVIVGFVQAIGTIHAADAAKSAAATAAKELELSQRPWITVEPQILSSLKFGADGARITIRLYIANTGHTPAVNVPDTMPEIYASFLTVPDPRQQRRDLCDQQRSQATNSHNWSFLQTIIPGSAPRDFNLLLSKDSIRTAAFDTPKKLFGSNAPTGHFEIEMAECVIYSSSFSSEEYAAAYVFDLERRIKEPPYENTVFSTEMTEIPASDLIIRYDPIAGNGPSTRY